MVKTCLINFTSALTSSEDHGRRHIAPLIGVDGIFLKCTLKVENEKKWLWFIQMVKSDFDLKDRDGFIITSDRPKLFPMEIAERKLSENDYNGAKKFINKAQNLYPKLDGLKTSVDDDQLKKQYKKLALLLHPDKYNLNGAEGAFKPVTEAWCMLSDKVKRTSYDQRRISKEAKTEIQKQPNPQNIGARSNKLASWIKKQLNPTIYTS
ncbi:Chaperone DnaJ-domain superfamily protein [Arabidopsis thaliana]|uniref:Chaperone DnaJ-domain superfamily protein n=1 Tax=Arabidopsis thaliana TaxID=3702 RepID=F4K8L9_ARATH|nr:Chaperone DnaJ-domain superfamily protein [Arabidopsis thaliana]AED94228.1 Chaperone DnaJ-domain superfamily protein [Arabidopsis thaliana]|eukprot:NP_198592.1 Chaperone DnaJ-domain superfamily protein [Arabidopsis thaliana]